METTGNFCLEWKDYKDNVSSAFRELRAESNFVDVTLGCSDAKGHSLQAHKAILSACSNFFKTMLQEQAFNYPYDQNVFIYLKGVSYQDLSHVLDFMYNGEINVASEDLNSFLALAEELQIKGLIKKDSESSKSRNVEDSSKEVECQICHKIIKSKMSLYKHSQRVHDDKAAKCEICEELQIKGLIKKDREFQVEECRRQ